MRSRRPELNPNNPDELAINAAWVVLKAHGVPDGLLGVFFDTTRETFVLFFEEEGTAYTEWVRLGVSGLDDLPVEVLKEAALRLVHRIRLTRARHMAVANRLASTLN